MNTGKEIIEFYHELSKSHSHIRNVPFHVQKLFQNNTTEMSH